MRNEKISFSKLKLTNNKQLAISQRQNQVWILISNNHNMFCLFVFLDDSDSEFNA